MRWFIRDTAKTRQTGRTTLGMALMIEEAIRNPGKKIHIFDHTGIVYGLTQRSRTHIIARINQMLQRSNVLPHRISIDYANGTLTIT